MGVHHWDPGVTEPSHCRWERWPAPGDQSSGKDVLLQGTAQKVLEGKVKYSDNYPSVFTAHKWL